MGVSDIDNDHSHYYCLGTLTVLVLQWSVYLQHWVRTLWIKLWLCNSIVLHVCLCMPLCFVLDWIITSQTGRWFHKFIRTIFPQSDAVATIFFSQLKLAVIIWGWQLNEGSDKNFHSIVTACMYALNFLAAALLVAFSASSTAFSLNASSYDLFCIWLAISITSEARGYCLWVWPVGAN